MEFKDRRVQYEQTYDCILNENGSITFEDNPGEIYEEGTIIDSELFKQLQSELQQNMENNNKRHIITSYLNKSTTVTTTGQYAKLPLTQYTSTGDKLTFDTNNNSIVIGAGVNKVKIDAVLNYKMTESTTSAKGLYIYKNGTYIGLAFCTHTGSARDYSQMVCLLPIVDVTEGDIIQMYIRTIAVDSEDVTINGAATGAQTNMTIEVIE